MSSVTEPPIARSQDAAVLSEPPRSFEYRPVPISAPVAVFFGISGLLAFLAWPGVLVALIGLFLAAGCLLKVYRSGGEYGGAWLAWSAFALSAVGFFGGVGVHSVAYATEVPEGHARLNFTQDISTKGFVVENRRPAAHPAVAALDGKQVFLKGYMYPTGQMEGLKAFVFCRDSGDCCFGGQPKIEDMIVVQMAGDATADYREGLVSVAGTFEILPDALANVGRGDYSLSPVFKITATRVERSRTSF